MTATPEPLAVILLRTEVARRQATIEDCEWQLSRKSLQRASTFDREWWNGLIARNTQERDELSAAIAKLVES